MSMLDLIVLCLMNPPTKHLKANSKDSVMCDTPRNRENRMLYPTVRTGWVTDESAK